MSAFEARRQARAERLHAAAARKRAEAEGLHAQNTALLGVMNGTPILVGHHSERRHRRDIARVDSRMGKAVALSKEAAELDRRADAAERNDAVSSDDPDALPKLREKLAKLEGDRAKLTTLRKACKSRDALCLLGEFGLSLSTAQEFIERGIPSYVGTNLSANIRRVKARIAEIEKAAERPAFEPVRIGSAVIEEADNRTRIRFDGKPSEELRTELKRNGFRWARSEGVWQRHASVQARWRAEQILRSTEVPAA